MRKLETHGSSELTKATREFFVFVVIAFACLLGLGLSSSTSVGCSSNPTAKDVTSGTKTAVQIADGTCSLIEEAVPNLPDWVTVACGGVSAADQVTKVVLPKTAWYAAKAATRDAGPGK